MKYRQIYVKINNGAVCSAQLFMHSLCHCLKSLFNVLAESKLVEAEVEEGLHAAVATGY